MKVDLLPGAGGDRTAGPFAAVGENRGLLCAEYNGRTAAFAIL